MWRFYFCSDQERLKCEQFSLGKDATIVSYCYSQVPQDAHFSEDALAGKHVGGSEKLEAYLS